MRPKTIIGWVAGATLVALCGAASQTTHGQAVWWVREYPTEGMARWMLARNPNDSAAHWTLARCLSRKGAPASGMSREAHLQAIVGEWREVARCDPSNEYIVCLAAGWTVDHGSHPEKQALRPQLTPIAQSRNVKTRAEARNLLRLLDTLDNQEAKNDTKEN